MSCITANSGTRHKNKTKQELLCQGQLLLFQIKAAPADMP